MLISRVAQDGYATIQNARGVTLVGVLVSAALIGILVILMVTLFGNMAQFTSRSWTETSIDQATSYIAGIVLNRDTCNTAFRTSTGAPLKWDYTTQPQGLVGEIVAPGSPATTIKPPQQFGPTLTLKKMYLREPDPSKKESGKAESTIYVEGKSYNTVVARLVLEFTNPAHMTGGVLQERYVDVTLGIDPSASYKIAFCFPQSDTTMRAYSCNQKTLQNQPASYGEADCTSPPKSSCQRLYFVDGFQDSGGPICACKWICPPDVEIVHPVM